VLPANVIGMRAPFSMIIKAIVGNRIDAEIKVLDNPV